MEPANLTKIGLSEPLSKAYLALLQCGTATPPQIAVQIKEKRPNTYALLEKLVGFGLANKQEISKKLYYRAQNPQALENFYQKQRAELLAQEKILKNIMPELVGAYFAGQEQPGVKFFAGAEGIKKVYKDQLDTGRPIYIIRSPADKEYFSFEFMHHVRNLARKQQLKRYVISPDTLESPKNWQKSDKEMLLERTWMKSEDYTAPVEWDIYGDKVAVISFAKEGVAMIITSPQIAESMRQLFRLLSEGLRRQPGYSSLPKKASY